MSTYPGSKIEQFDKYGKFLPVRGTVAELRLYPTADLNAGDMIKTSGFAVYTDGQGGDWTWNPTSQAPDDGVSVVQPAFLPAGRWTRIVSSLGVVANSLGTSTSLAPSQAAIAPLQNKLLQFVLVSDYGNNDVALQQAINSGAKEVIVNIPVSVTKDINLAANQIVRFAGGRINVTAGATITKAVLYSGIGNENITILDAVIDASATAGVCGIDFINVNTARLAGGKLTKCWMALESYDPAVSRMINVSDYNINLSGFGATAIYISGIRGVTVRNCEVYGGGEGIGFYNGARSIRISDTSSHDHARDGFVIINAQEVTFANCFGYNNAQSGFTTQRQTAASNAGVTSWTGCHAWDNAADGFDIRGSNDVPWGVDTQFQLSASTSRNNGPNNGGCGFFIVPAEGTTLDNCSATGNKLQGLFIHTSDRVIATGFRSISNGFSVPSGVNKAGILIYNSNNVQIVGAVSSNTSGLQQQYGVSFTGTAVGGRVIGGDFSNNINGGYIAGNNAIISSLANYSGGAGVFFISQTERGITTEEGYGVPTHARPKGSLFTRLDGGNGELYISNGVLNNANSWSRLAYA